MRVMTEPHDQVRCGCDHLGAGRFSCGHSEADDDQAEVWARDHYQPGMTIEPGWPEPVRAACARMEAEVSDR